MIDNFRVPRRRFDNLHPRVKDVTKNIVASDHSKDSFKTPDQVAATEEQGGDQATAGKLPSNQPGGAQPPALPPKTKRSFKQWFRGLNTKQKVLLTAGAAVLVAGLVIGTYFLFFSSSAPLPQIVQKQEPAPPPAPTTVPSNLTGLQVDPEINDRPVTAIMIENSLDARPQAGLRDAGVVFEAIAEGGITRFVALFQDTEPKYIGPVRSVRPYYLSWLVGFDAAIAHAGGSAKALSYINQWRVKDLNHNAAYFWRVSNRTAPHNLYTSIEKLRAYEKQKGFGKANYTPLPRKDKETPAATPTAAKIDFNISSPNFNVRYLYDAASNSYDRSEGGQKHKDEKSGKQLSPKVVVALIMPQGKSDIYTTYDVLGGGQVIIFQDGKVYKGTWKKESNNDNLSFKDTNGTPLKLNPGQTWFTALGAANRVTYSP
jgi:hypothetical protein